MSMLHRYGAAPRRLFREGDRVKIKGSTIFGRVIFNEQRTDTSRVAVLWDGKSQSNAADADAIELVTAGTRARTVVANAPIKARRTRCPIPGCDEDHGEDGHPADYDERDDNESRERRERAIGSFSRRGVR